MSLHWLRRHRQGSSGGRRRPRLTPEADLVLASWGRRVAARLIDAVIWVGILVIGWAIVSADSDMSSETIDLLTGLWFFSYLVLYDWLAIGWKGQTAGKAVMGLKVVRAAEGGTVSYGRSFVRMLASVAIGVIPFGGLVDYLLPLFDRRRQTIHDKVGRTLVVRLS